MIANWDETLVILFMISGSRQFIKCFKMIKFISLMGCMMSAFCSIFFLLGYKIVSIHGSLYDMINHTQVLQNGNDEKDEKMLTMLMLVKKTKAKHTRQHKTRIKCFASE